MSSGTFQIGGEVTVNRLGYGAMQITGRGVWGPPKDRAEAIRVLKRLPELGIDFIDTADSYGPDVSEQLIRAALHPYDGLLIATKAGFTRSGPDRWHVDCRPEYLIAQARKSCRQLGIEQIGLWQLHRIDTKVPRDEQFGVIRDMQKEGLIRHVGLSEVSVEDIQAAEPFFKVATVQNLYNLGNRQSEAVLDYATEHGIGFIPWFPLAAGELAKEGSVLSTIAKKLGATDGQVALAWLLKRSPVMLPIPGTGNPHHLADNVKGASLELSQEDFEALEHAVK